MSSLKRIIAGLTEGINSPGCGGFYKDDHTCSTQNNYTTNYLSWGASSPTSGISKPNINVIGGSSMSRVGPAFGGHRM
jgi:hypothetical protein